MTRLTEESGALMNRSAAQKIRVENLPHGPDPRNFVQERSAPSSACEHLKAEGKPEDGALCFSSYCDTEFRVTITPRDWRNFRGIEQRVTICQNTAIHKIEER